MAIYTIILCIPVLFHLVANKLSPFRSLKPIKIQENKNFIIIKTTYMQNKE